MYCRIIPLLAAFLTISAGCTRYDADYKLPGVYRIDIQQGNVLEQEMLDRLRPGMNQDQVRFIMGTPAINDPFHKDRWDYIYTLSRGGGQRRQMHISLHFQDGELAYLDGDVEPGLRRPSDLVRQPSKTVDVPQMAAPRKGFFARMWDVLPFVGDD